MHPAAEHAIELLQDKITYIEEKLTFIPMDLIEGMFPEGEWNVDTWQDFEFHLPYNFVLMHLVNEVFEQMGFEKGTESIYIANATYAQATHRFKASAAVFSSQFEVNFESSADGATCVVNKVAEETVTKEIYEVVCGEEAAKEFTYDDGS